MSVEVTVRHLDISDTLQDFAKEKSGKLMEAFPAIEFIRVVLDKDGPFCVATFSVQGGQRTTVDGTHKDADMIAAINGAYDKVESMLRKNSEKRQDFRG